MSDGNVFSNSWLTVTGITVQVQRETLHIGRNFIISGGIGGRRLGASIWADLGSK